jgi:thioredoxin-like negative regulator of GroEL
MIERLLAADRAFEAGELDAAARLFGQVVEADPRNAIAVLGLAKVALGRGERDEARRLTVAALAIDPDDDAARRLLEELERAAVPSGSTAAPRQGGVLGWLRRLFRGRA